ncbi:tripartite tricarboxylate transporter TctA domain protein [Bordetella bronchiseptica E014]|nr:tripartite tricarboxylate transporter TctA domain protein [Bordetella bronchiseptica E014]
MIILGLLLGMVGTDVNSGVARYDFGIPELQDGIDFAIVAMGVFGFAEILTNLEQKENRVDITDKVGSLYPNLQEFAKPRRPWCAAPPWVRPGHPAGRRLGAVVVRLVLAGRKSRAIPSASARATRPAWPAPNRPTTPARRPRSSRC